MPSLLAPVYGWFTEGFDTPDLKQAKALLEELVIMTLAVTQSAWWKLTMSTIAAHPARILPPEQRLSTFRLLRTVIDNPIKAWPRKFIRSASSVRASWAAILIYVMAPDLIRRVLVDGTEDFEKGEMFRRGLGPVLGDAILTADGSRWRWQRRAVASIFRQERIRSFVPAMIAAAERSRDRFRSHSPAVEIDIAGEMMRTTFDIIMCTIVWGRISVDRDLIEQSINHYLEPTSWVWPLPWPARRLDTLSGIAQGATRMEYLHHALDALIDDAKRNPGDRGDILSLTDERADPETGTR